MFVTPKEDPSNLLLLYTNDIGLLSTPACADRTQHLTSTLYIYIVLRNHLTNTPHFQLLNGKIAFQVHMSSHLPWPTSRLPWDSPWSRAQVWCCFYGHAHNGFDPKPVWTRSILPMSLLRPHSVVYSRKLVSKIEPKTGAIPELRQS